MSEKVVVLFEELADRADVGPPPTQAMLADARRSVRHRRLGVVLGSAAVVATVALGVGLLPGVVSGNDPAGPEPTAPVSLPGPGMRLVGVMDVAVEVPASWPTNRTQCGTPLADTVVVDQGAIGMCGVFRKPGVTSVALEIGRPRLEFHPDSETEVDGVTVRRESTTCAGPFRGVVECVSTLHFPGRDVWVRADASATTQQEARREVTEALARVHVLSDRVGVPGWRSLSAEPQDVAYLARLTSAGLTAHVVHVARPGMHPGTVLKVSPASGTVLEPGSTVTVTVVAPQHGLAEQMAAGVSTSSADDPDDMRLVSDAQLRAGADLTVAVGDTIWTTYNVEHNTLNVTTKITGDAVLRAEDGTWESWTATAPGRATITLFVDDGTRRERLGEVRIRVR